MVFVDKLEVLREKLREKRLERSRLCSEETGFATADRAPSKLAQKIMAIDAKILELELEVIKLGG